MHGLYYVIANLDTDNVLLHFNLWKTAVTASTERTVMANTPTDTTTAIIQAMGDSTVVSMKCI